jgi:predicted nucleotidyltransferase
MISEREKDVLAGVLSPYANQIERVGVFGSRATGTAKPISDIDLVIYGDIDAMTERRLWTLFQESNLPMPVDVVVYARVKYQPLKAHIDAVARVIFQGNDLKARAACLRARS